MAGSKLTPEQQKELADLRRLAALEAKYGKQEEATPDAPAETSLLHKALVPLDYLGGLGRTTAAAMAGATKEGDWTEALHGNAPSSADYLRRMDLPDGSLSDLMPSMYGEPGDGTFKPNKGGMLDPTAKGTAGFAMDVALDPLTYASGGASALGKLAKAEKLAQMGKLGNAISKTAEVGSKTLSAVGDPLKEGTKWAGEKLYKSGFKAADEVARDFGKTAASDIMWKNRVTGTSQQIADKASELAQNLNRERETLLREADAAGAVVDMEKAMEQGNARIAEALASRDPSKIPVAEKLRAKLQEYQNLTQGRDSLTNLPTNAPVNASQAAGMKSSLYDAIGDQAYKDAAATTTGKAIQKDMARGLKTAIEDAANKAKAGLGDTIAATNNDLGTLLTVQGAFDKEAAKAGRKNLVTQIDPIAFAIHPYALPAKKAVQVMNSPWFRTNVGLGMHDLASKIPLGIYDTAIRRALVSGGQASDNPNPWFGFPTE